VARRAEPLPARDRPTPKRREILSGRRNRALDLARNAQRLFAKQEPREKRRLLYFLLSNCTRKDGEVAATFRQPFDLLAETTAFAARQKAQNMADLAKTEAWLPEQDSNLRPID
jgi:hypothetical protein